MDSTGLVTFLNALLNTLQVCFLAYLAARYRQNGNGSGTAGNATVTTDKGGKP